MKQGAFGICVIGIFVLFGFFAFDVEEVGGAEDLEKLELNQRVVLNGEVLHEEIRGSLKIMNIDGIEVVCECLEVFHTKFVRVEGRVDEYLGGRQVRALKIMVLEDR